MTLSIVESQPSPARAVVSSVIDTQRGFVYFGTYGVIAKVNLSGFLLTSINLGNSAYLGAAAIDVNNGFAYFGDNRGKVFKIDLSTFNAAGSLDTGIGSIASACIDNTGGFVYFGSEDGLIAKIRLSDFTSSIALSLGYGLSSCVIDESSSLLYFGTVNYPTGVPGRIVRIRLSDFTADELQLPQSHSLSAIIDTVNGFAYFGNCDRYGGSPSIIKIDLPNFTNVDSIPIPTYGCNSCSAISDRFAYFGTSAGIIIKVSLSDFTIVETLDLSSFGGQLTSTSLDVANGFGYFGTSAWPNSFIIKVSDPDMMPPEVIPEGCIKFVTSPSANICIDNVDTGQLTPSTLCGYTVGNSYTYTLVRKDYISISGNILIPSGEGIIINETLTHETGSINANSDPAGAKIILDDIDTGKITPDIIDNVSTGIHTCTLSLEGYYDYNIIVRVWSNQTTDISETLDKSTSYQPQAITNGAFDTDLSGWNQSVSGSAIEWINGTVHIYGSYTTSGNISQDFVIKESVITLQYMSDAPANVRWDIIVDGNVVRTGRGYPYMVWTNVEIDVSEFIDKNATIIIGLFGGVFYGTSNLWIDNIANTPIPRRLATFDTYCMNLYNPCHENPIVVCQTDVYLDGVFIGKTPLSNNLSVGSHPYSILKKGYKDTESGNDNANGNIFVQEGTSIGAYITRIFESKTELPSAGCVFFESNPPGARIILDGTDTGRITPDMICNISLGISALVIHSSTLAQHSYGLILSHYYEVTGIFNTNNIMGETISEDLVPKVGGISFDSIPRGAKIILDGTDTGKVTPDTVDNIIEGIHTYDLILDNFNIYTCEINVIMDQTISVNPMLTPVEGCLYLDSCPSSEIFIDDIDTGYATPYFTCVTMGHHKLTLSLAGYKDYIEEVDMPIGGGINRKENLIWDTGVPFIDPSKEICLTPGVTRTTYSPVYLDFDTRYIGKDTFITQGNNLLIIDAQGYNTIHIRAFVYLPNLRYSYGGVIRVYQSDVLGDCIRKPSCYGELAEIPADAELLLDRLDSSGWYIISLFEGSLDISKRYIIIAANNILFSYRGCEIDEDYGRIYIMESIPVECPIIQTTVCVPIQVGCLIKRDEGIYSKPKYCYVGEGIYKRV